LGNAIIGAYSAIEPWVAYGVDLADYALGWVPYGWLIGDQINIFYDSLEPGGDRSATTSAGGSAVRSASDRG
jgi:hypothetical protein